MQVGEGMCRLQRGDKDIFNVAEALKINMSAIADPFMEKT